jgi:hypothetical protein
MLRLTKNKIGIIIVFLVFSACTSAEITETQLLGKYKVTYKHGVEILVLNGDGTYLQEYMNNESHEVNSNKGGWKYDLEDKSIYLKEALLFNGRNNNARRPPQKGGWLVYPEIYNKKIELWINEDGSLSFAKIVSEVGRN